MNIFVKNSFLRKSLSQLRVFHFSKPLGKRKDALEKQYFDAEDGYIELLFFKYK